MLLITGATGNIGRELTRLLDARGAEFRVLVRDPAKVAVSDRVVRHAVEPAAAAGVRRIVHLSSFNVLGDPMPAMAAGTTSASDWCAPAASRRRSCGRAGS